ncbi:MAG: ABC transporter ATP-binding protein [Dehalococcoidia bacterium]
MEELTFGEEVLNVQNLHTYLYTRWGIVKAVDGVTFSVSRGETLGIVGESGSGKSMTALSLMRLQPRPAGRIVQGEVWLEGTDLLKLSDQQIQRVRGRDISMILQDPQTSLNPVFSVGNQLLEAVGVHNKGIGRKGLVARAVEALRSVRVAAPEQRFQDYPHQMSGGMKQRVVGAISISCEPKVIIADEPTTALDVTIQAQYLELLQDIQRDTGLAIIFITHDFGIVANMCDRVVVMYAGKIVEQGEVREIFNHPSHPYTRALLDSVPNLESKAERLYSIQGQPPALWDLGTGCRFAPRCPYSDQRCYDEYPPSYTVKGEHTADCWRLEDANWRMEPFSGQHT